ncbi:MAG: alpha-ribazole phosphatase [Thermoanaerobacterales bacterium]|nr:alpha-ribazole phosphatase [Thermoanaerobacterales bacterium]
MGCRIYLVRHGETLWNHAMRYQGHADIPLNEKGYTQARAVARRLSSERIDAVYSSDLQRARVTAEAIAAVHGLPVQIDRSLREINFGAWEGLTRDEIRLRFPDVSREWWSNPVGTRLPGGETLAEVADRAVSYLLGTARRHPGGTVVVASHGGTIRAVIGRLIRMDLNEYWRLRQDNAALNLLEVQDGDRAVLLLFNDTSHLLAST